MQRFENFINEVGFNIARIQMPQINNVEDFIEYVSEQGFETLRFDAYVPIIKCTQQDFDQSKVNNIITFDKPIIISNDYFVLDGHHRFISAKQKGMRYINAYFIDLGINKLLKLANDYLGVNDG